jgi:preprotein translocase subunit SecD
MRNLVFRMFFIIFIWLLLTVYIFPWHSYNIDVPFSGKDYKLWLDLQWWIELDYKIDLTEVKLEEDYSASRENEIVEWLKSIIDRRVQTLNINDSNIIDSNYAWEKHIIVQIPMKWNDSFENIENIKKAKEAIWKVVKIEFKEINPNTWTWELEWIRALDSEWRYLSDKYFVKSSVQFNQAFQPMIELTFNTEWAKIFGDLTKRMVWQRLAIFVWGELLTDPNINEPILSWKAVITWNYTAEEARQLSTNINTWVVPAPIYLTSEKTIDSRLWASSLWKLIYAWLLWFLIIFVFLISIYRISGLMASISLFLYIIIILFILKILGIVLTLASIAWLILSIGMAIDANILIFERIKDEIKEWKSLKDASVVWFKKSWSAIWDSNVTWFIVAMILFIFWINLIKWFWLMLAIWIVVSLFTAMWISRILIILVANVMKNKKLFIWK